MSAPKFTPGPWFGSKGAGIYRRHPDDLYENGGQIAGEKPLAIALQGWYGPNNQGFPVEANTRLIAAAPELYEALMQFVTIWKRTTGEAGDQFNSAALDACAALAKAQGIS